MIYMLGNGFCMIWEIIWVFFDTFTKVRTSGQHPDGTYFYVFIFLHVSVHYEPIRGKQFFTPIDLYILRPFFAQISVAGWL